MILAVGCDYAPVDDWEGILPAIKAPSNYKKPEAITGYIDKRLAELRDGKAGVDPVVGSVIKAVIINGDSKVVFAETGQVAGAEALMFLSEQDSSLVFGLKLRRMIRFMVLNLVLRDGELPTAAQWAVDLDPHARYNRGDFVDPISVLFGSSDTDIEAVARRVGYEAKRLDTARGMANLALALGGLLGLGG